ncbi:MAG: PQQ-binding-like beta-propeller repeat protein [Phycisphaerales bacterium]
MISIVPLIIALVPSQGTWTHAGGTCARNALASTPLPDIAQASWTRSVDQFGNVITFRYQSTPIVNRTHVFVLGAVRPAGFTQDVFKCFAIRRDTGEVAWATTLPTPVAALGSQSSAALSERLGVLYVPANNTITALRASDGVQLWQATLPRTIVNASPCVTDDLAANRLFITDYDFDIAGAPGSLHCINLDATTPANPFTPGQNVWSYPIQGLSGNSPAYLPKRMGGPRSSSGAPLVFVATAGSPDIEPGRVLAFDAAANESPTPVWEVSNSIPQGFFGGVGVSIGPSGRAEVMASSYAFFDQANTLRIDAASGAVISDLATNRSGVVPIALRNAISGSSTFAPIVMSTGYDGFGSVPSLELLARDTTGMSMVWNSWTAAALRIGGWNHQPAATLTRGKHLLVTGTIAANANTNPAQGLKIIDLTLPPSNPNFAMQGNALAGGSVAIAGLNIFSVGSAGLCEFGPSWTKADIDANATIATADVYQWETNWQSNSGPRDVDGDAVFSMHDRETLLDWIRSDERTALMGVRP